MPHICVRESGQHWFRQWPVAYSAPSHYLNQCLGIVNWTLRNTLQWNFNQIRTSSKKMHLKMSSAKMVVILSRGTLVKGHISIDFLIVTATYPTKRNPPVAVDSSDKGSITQQPIPLMTRCKMHSYFQSALVWPTSHSAIDNMLQILPFSSHAHYDHPLQLTCLKTQ